MNDAELEAFEEAIDDLGDRVTEFLAEGTNRTPEEIAATVEDLPRPDTLNDQLVEEY
ncbi:hypothetical protein [Salinigranum marinum]|uniref:hypothetical protein n=1 Tax=Salinigranum marinum TaxID=1515595 RepID=UPI002989B47E|nr:hypothetical protein [Salinigranum marinum]